MNEENLAESDNSVEEPQTDNQAKISKKSLLSGVIDLIGCRNHIGPQKMGQILRAWQQS